jgi:putative FmdB family regulatory protein
MPIYEYRCPDCGEVFELFLRSHSSTEPIRCPRCGSTAPERILSRFSAAAGSASAATGSGGCASTGFS